MRELTNRTKREWVKRAVGIALAVGPLWIGQIAVAQLPSDKGDHVVTGGDLAFMNDAAPGGLAEVQLGQLAAERATSDEVRQFAKQMIADHSKAGEELKQLAEQKKVILPPGVLPMAKQTEEKLSKLKGAEFDRAYAEAMVAAHEKDVAAFNAVAQNATDADVKAFAAKTAPVLRHHLQMIRDIATGMHLQTK